MRSLFWNNSSKMFSTSGSPICHVVLNFGDDEGASLEHVSNDSSIPFTLYLPRGEHTKEAHGFPLDTRACASCLSTILFPKND